MNRADALETLVGGAGRGSVARQRAEEERRLRRDFSRNRLALERRPGGADAADIAGINKRQEEALQSLRDYYATEDTLRQDWRTGYTRSFEDYYDNAQNVADRVSDAMTRGLTAVEDAFVSLATTGKASFSGLANAIISDVVRISVRMAMANSMGGGGGWLGSLVNLGMAYFSGGSNGMSMQSTNSMVNGLYMADGGYTGAGGKYEWAGDVHKGEIVWSQEDIRAHGGVDHVDRMRRSRRGPGYANGGPVGGFSGGGAGGPLVNVIIQNNGTETEVQQKKNSMGGLDLMVIARAVEQYVGGNVAAGMGPVAKGGESRYGWKTSMGR